MTATTAPLSSDVLRAELRDVTAQLRGVEQEWRSLTNDPHDFRRRADLASSIEQLRARVAALPQEIDAAERQEHMLTGLREQERAARARAEADLHAFIEQLPTRDDMLAILRTCAAVNHLAARLAQYESVPPPLNALARIKVAFAHLSTQLFVITQTGAVAQSGEPS